MRRGIGVIAAVVAVTAAGPRSAPAQAPAEPQYWRVREVNFPVSADQLNAANPKPAKLRFYVAPNRGEWQQVREAAVADLDPIDPGSNRRGFRYATPADGEYDFALQLVFADGTAQPRKDELVAQRRLIVDTRPPLVKVAAVGSSTVEWAVDDENLRSDGVTVETRWQGERDWIAIRPRAFRPRDSYTWNGLNPRDILEVRLIARDKAGNEAASRVVSLPSAGGGPGLGANPFPQGGRTGGALNGGGGADAAPTQSYSNTRALTVTSKLRVTRSGVRAAHLWMTDGKTGWKNVKNVDLAITPNAPDQSVQIPYAVAKDGQYGFIVIPENGAGNKDPDPRPDAVPQSLIVVDTEKPFVQVTNARVLGAGVRGPKLEIEWKAEDPNLYAEPITLEYADSRTPGEWKPIHAGDSPRLPNNGRYVWEVEDQALWKFTVRARALDMAGNEGQHVYPKDVIIDLEVPKATIEKVQGTGPGGNSLATPGPNERTDSSPPNRLPPESPPANPVVPASNNPPPAANPVQPTPPAPTPPVNTPPSTPSPPPITPPSPAPIPPATPNPLPPGPTAPPVPDTKPPANGVPMIPTLPPMGPIEPPKKP